MNPSENHCERWSDEHRKILREKRAKGFSYPRIARLLGRTAESVRSRANKDMPCRLPYLPKLKVRQRMTINKLDLPAFYREGWRVVNFTAETVMVTR